MNRRLNVIKSVYKILFAVCIGFTASNAPAYERIGNSHWSPPEASFLYGALSNADYRKAFIKAMESWNGKSAFAYSGDSGYDDPCAFNPVNTVSIYGHCAKFGSSTLAIAVTGIQADDTFFDVDIYFNPSVNWGVHNNPAGSSSKVDFTRVAIHELGHALGLAHENTKPAVMQALYPNMAQVPTADDIAGLLAIYGVAPPILPDFYFSTLFNILLEE